MNQYSDIIDNRSINLKDQINNQLASAEKVKFAVGYLYLSGFYQIADNLEKLEEAKLLVGSNLNKQLVEALAESLPGEDELAEEYENNRLQRPAEKKKIGENLTESMVANVQSLPHTIQRQQEISKLTQLIQENKVKIKVYTKHPLHAKAYIFKYKPEHAKATNSDGIAIIGSSNLTMSGFYHNTELNTYVRGQKNYEELDDWFKNLWEEAIPFEEALINVLEESWALKTVNPYDIYILTLYHLTKANIEKQTSQIWFWENPDFMIRLTARFKAMKDLFPFQKVAIMQSFEWVQKYNGMFVSDVVGLGKTFIGAGILKQINRRALIISPPGLVSMWEDFVEKFEIDGKVISRGMLRNGEYGKNSSLWQYREREIVLIDESHHFRNSDTKMYREVQPFLADKRVILMTATPQNTSPWNIYNQIKLFNQTEENPFPNRYEEPHLRNLFKKVDNSEYALPDLLKYIVIRRTRKHIKQFYTDSEFGIHFPKRELETVTYNINETYKNLYDNIRSCLKKLKYARYNLWDYVIEEKKQVDPYIELKKVVGTLRVFHKINLFKRLESSIFAFRMSINNLLSIHQKVLKIIQEKGIVPAGEQIQDKIYRYDLSEFWDEIEDLTRDYCSEDFDIEKLESDLIHDIQIFKKIQAQLVQIPENIDAKYDELLTVIEDLRRKRLQTKILIFSEYADTVDYLHKRLCKSYKNAEKVHGETLNNAEKIMAFSPTPYDYDGDLKIDLLVATDVVSEGHNLQDCSAVINYDLHWNPVRLIQRAGRVDRIGSEATIIYIKNFLPTDIVRREISLQETLERRIADIHEYIGEDEKVLTPNEKINDTDMYAIYQTKDLEHLEDDETRDFTTDEAEIIIKNLQKEKPEYMALINKMQLGLRSAKKALSFDGTYAFFRAGDFARLFIKMPDGKIIDNFSGVLNEIRCDFKETEMKIKESDLEKYFDDVNSLKKYFADQISDENLSARIDPEIRNVQKRLERMTRDRIENKDFVENASKIDKVLTSFFPRHLIAKLKGLNKQEKDDDRFYEELVNMYNSEKLSELVKPQETKRSSIEFVCGEVII